MEFNENYNNQDWKNLHPGTTWSSISRTAISKWESGKGYPNIESLKVYF